MKRNGICDNSPRDDEALFARHPRHTFTVRTLLDLTTVAAVSCTAAAYFGTIGLRGLVAGGASAMLGIFSTPKTLRSDLCRFLVCVGAGGIGGASACVPRLEWCIGLVAGSLGGGSVALFWYRLLLPRLNCDKHSAQAASRTHGFAQRFRRAAWSVVLLFTVGSVGGLLAGALATHGGSTLPQDARGLIGECLVVGLTASSLASVPVVVAILLCD